MNMESTISNRLSHCQGTGIKRAYGVEETWDHRGQAARARSGTCGGNLGVLSHGGGTVKEELLSGYTGVR